MKDFKEHIYGCLFGQAVGDALGLGTECMTKEEVIKYYPNGLTDYSQIIVDYHRRKWQKGEWTDDTDMMLCIANALIEDKGVDLTHIARNFKAWFNDNPRGIGSQTCKLLVVKEYVEKPFEASELIWKMSRKEAAGNGGLMRTSVVGLLPNDVAKHAEDICRLTHFDPRCIGSSVIWSEIIHSLVYDDRELSVNDIIDIANRYDERIKPYVVQAKESDFEELVLDDERAGYTLTTLMVALWCYFHINSFEEGLFEVVNAGGDADTNAAVACSMLGAKYGYSAIPKSLIDGLVDRERLESVCKRIRSDQ